MMDLRLLAQTNVTRADAVIEEESRHLLLHIRLTSTISGYSMHSDKVKFGDNDTDYVPELGFEL